MTDPNDDTLAGRRDPQRFRDEDEIDREALTSEKSEWVGRNDPAAGDPVSEDERRGLNQRGQRDPRGNDAIGGASDQS